MKLFYFAQGPVAPLAALFCSTGHITHPVRLWTRTTLRCALTVTPLTIGTRPPPVDGASMTTVCECVPVCECVCVDDHDHAAYCSVLETNCIPLGGYAVYTPFVFTSRWHAYFAYWRTQTDPMLNVCLKELLHSAGFSGPFACPSDSFCPASGNF